MVPLYALRFRLFRFARSGLGPSKASVGDILLELLRRFRKTIGVKLRVEGSPILTAAPLEPAWRFQRVVSLLDSIVIRNSSKEV